MDALARAAVDQPEAAALVTADRVISYRELDRAAWGVADMVLGGGSIGRSAVALWGDRTPEAVAAVWGIPRAGVAAVPIDPRIPPASAMAATRSAGVRGLWSPPTGGFDRLVARDAPSRAAGVGEYVVFTSGSEGVPKGVRLTQANVAASVRASQQRLGHGPGDAWLCVLPLFHVGGLAILWRQAAAAAPVLLHESFDAAAVARSFDGVAFVSLVPVMLRRVLEHTPIPGGSLRAVLVGGAASDPGLLALARSEGVPAVPTYGMTETTSQVATPDPTEPLDGTVGTAVDGAEIRVVQGDRAVVGEIGRIEVRGPMVTPGFVGEPERPADAWMVTGDLGSIGPSGRLMVVGRADAVIVTGGENVHPQAVEAALRGLDGIRDLRVFGMPDAEWGVVVVAEVETDLDRDRLDALAQRLPPAMRPRRWEIVTRVQRKLDV